MSDPKPFFVGDDGTEWFLEQPEGGEEIKPFLTVIHAGSFSNTAEEAAPLTAERFQRAVALEFDRPRVLAPQYEPIPPWLLAALDCLGDTTAADIYAGTFARRNAQARAEQA